ncbi:crAss001_48 related protein [Bifidobacterium olomucense]|uniref:Uncharacterized protein n=1 Tax=Bifidobacterium olomucense TaxID=2675324 RepID=A0A7Y0HWX3_9BIFI|nr:hypothetical protein [Bifidobacterium sp. DSM 109959]NMM98118.1 hypothetical protein [Bifidobacterium sp. DSM 109959]
MGTSEAEEIDLPSYLGISAVEAHLVHPADNEGKHTHVVAHDITIMPQIGVMFHEAEWDGDPDYGRETPSTIIVPFHNIAAIRDVETVTIGAEDLDDWKNRLVTEHNELLARYMKLAGILDLESEDGEDVLAGQRGLMEQQRDLMRAYLRVLEQRAMKAGLSFKGNA